MRTLSFTSNVDIAALRRGVRALLSRGQIARAAGLLTAALPAWPARCALPLVDPAIPDAERTEQLEDRLFDARIASLRWMRALRVAATVASALGFIGAAIEIHWVFNADHGLLRLEAGRVESVGFQRATLSVALGIATSSLALGSFTILRKVALDRLAQCRRLVAAVEDALDSPIDEGIAQASRDRLAPENRVASEPPTADGV